MAISRNLKNITAKINKKYGDGYSSIASEFTKTISFQQSGSFMLDNALGGGFPEGRIGEIYGPESAGKTTTMLIAISQRQKYENKRAEEDEEYIKKSCIFVDAEKTFDIKIASEYGIDISELIIVDAVTAEESMDILRLYIESGEIALAVVDSVAALNPAQIENSSFEQQSMGVQARFMATVCRGLAGIVSKTNTSLVFINQIREKIGAYGNPETTPGGRALKFYSSYRIVVRQGEIIKEGDQRIGHQLKYNIIKNKVSEPYKTASTFLIYGVGIDNFYERMEQSFVVDNIWAIGGAWYTYVDENGEIPMNPDTDKPLYKFNGKAKVAQALSEDSELFDLISSRLENQHLEAESMSPEEIALIKDDEVETEKEFDSGKKKK